MSGSEPSESVAFTSPADFAVERVFPRRYSVDVPGEHFGVFSESSVRGFDIPRNESESQAATSERGNPTSATTPDESPLEGSAGSSLQAQETARQDAPATVGLEEAPQEVQEGLSESPRLQKSRITRLLLSNASHEVRTPLNAIINYLELALEERLEDSTRDLLVKAYNASKSLVYVIDDLLNLTKVEAGSVAVPQESFDLGATVSEVIATFRRESMRRGLDLTVSTHHGLPDMVKGDAARLTQVLSNVISNAFQSSHSHQGGIKVDINSTKLEEKKSVVEITVQDMGVGMSEQQLDDLFRELEQVSDEEDPSGSAVRGESDVPDKEVLGLGLAVVARYVRNHRGRIKVRSALGKGTVFTIELPFEHAPPSPVESGSSSSSPQPKIVQPRSYTPDKPSIARSLESTGTASTLQSWLRIPETQRMSGRGNAPSPVRPMPRRMQSIEAAMSDVSPISYGNLSELSGFSRLSSDPMTYPFPDMSAGRPDSSKVVLSVLIAEDNPVNARVLQKRLEKSGHRVQVAVEGQSCHDLYNSNPDGYDVILMDLQMPLVDGPTATKMIRELEQALSQGEEKKRRIPIFAVSASLSEDQRFDYVQYGFDAWVLKPIDYGRLEELMQGIHKSEARRSSVYIPGLFEQGGWFIP